MRSSFRSDHQKRQRCIRDSSGWTRIRSCKACRAFPHSASVKLKPAAAVVAVAAAAEAVVVVVAEAAAVVAGAGGVVARWVGGSRSVSPVAGWLVGGGSADRNRVRAPGPPTWGYVWRRLLKP